MGKSNKQMIVLFIIRAKLKRSEMSQVFIDGASHMPSKDQGTFLNVEIASQNL